MSSYITHYYFGQQVRKNLPEKEAINDVPLAFNFGLQGPDLYFYYFDKYSPAMGNLTHNFKIYEQFASMLNFAKKNKDNAYLSYCYGMLCHYALDSVMHPYVYFMQEEVLPKFYSEKKIKGLHMILETAIDYCVIKKKMNGELKRGSSCLTTDSRSQNAIADIHMAVYAPLYNAPLNRKKLISAIKLFKTYQAMFDDPTKILPTVFKGISAITSYPPKLYGFIPPSTCESEQDWLNETHRHWNRYRKEDEVVDWDFDKIIEVAQDKAKDLIEDFDHALLTGGTLNPEYYVISYDGNRVSNPAIE